MSFKLKSAIAVLLILAYDTGASFLSRLLESDYENFALGSFAIYLFCGYWGAYRLGTLYGLALATLVGFTESTAGWFISSLIQPITSYPTVMVGDIFFTVVIVTATSAAIGLVGAATCGLLGQTAPIGEG